MAIPQTLFEFIFQNVDFLMEVIGGEGADLLENFVRKSALLTLIVTNIHEAESGGCGFKPSDGADFEDFHWC